MCTSLSMQELPQWFCCLFADELGDELDVSVLRGTSFTVGLEKEGLRVRLNNKWADFVNHYTLQVGYKLECNFDAQTGILVKVFDSEGNPVSYEYRSIQETTELDSYLEFHKERVGSRNSPYMISLDWDTLIVVSQHMRNMQPSCYKTITMTDLEGRCRLVSFVMLTLPLFIFTFDCIFKSVGMALIHYNCFTECAPQIWKTTCPREKPKNLAEDGKR